LKNLNCEVNESNGDPGKCNSNAGYLSLSDQMPLRPNANAPLA
jgi:hypothetical protein